MKSTVMMEARIAALENVLTILVTIWGIERGDLEGELEYVTRASMELAIQRLASSQVGPEQELALKAMSAQQTLHERFYYHCRKK